MLKLGRLFANIFASPSKPIVQKALQVCEPDSCYRVSCAAKRSSLTFTSARQSGRCGRRASPSGTVMAVSSKASQGQITEAALLDWAGQPKLIDVGLNLADSSFDKDRVEVLARAARAGVGAAIITGSSLQSSRAASHLVQQPGPVALYFTAGVHPHEAKHWDEQTAAEIRELAQQPRCVAVGECGLDFNRDFSPRDQQEHAFEQQVQLACDLRKPLFMHCRDAASSLAAILRRHNLTAPGVVHCFTGSKQELEVFLDMGLCIGITGWVCDDRPDRGGAELAALLPTIPTQRLMIETDAPYLVPRTIKPSRARPRRNEPALLPHVLQQVAASLGKPLEQVANETSATAVRIFELNPV